MFLAPGLDFFSCRCGYLKMTLAVFVWTLTILSFAGLVFSAAVGDILRYTVPNRVCLAAVLVYPAYILAAPYPVDWAPAAVLAGAALALGFVLFSLRVWGGGDAKLFAVVALWAGPAHFLGLTLLTALSGGVIAIYLYIHHRLTRVSSPGAITLSNAEAGFERQSMPYGAAIAVGGLYVAFTLLRVS